MLQHLKTFTGEKIKKEGGDAQKESQGLIKLKYAIKKMKCSLADLKHVKLRRAEIVLDG